MRQRFQKGIGRALQGVTLALACSCALAEGFTLEGTIFEKAGREFNVDPYLLYSISIVESAVDAPGRKGHLQPSPWTLRTDRPFYAASRAEAEIELDRLLRKGRSVDVGLMQINTKWHRRRVANVFDLIDPLTNVRVAASILNELIRRYPKDSVLAIGNYHSSRPERARWYARHVLRVYTNLKNQAGK